MTVRVVQFIAILCGALALIPAGAHLAALPNKIGLPQAQYFTVQAIYRGWSILGALWVGGLLLNAWLAILVRGQWRPFMYAVSAALCFVALFAIFVVWTLPANQATANWTTVPDGWEALRRNWEYSHAVNAAIAFLALAMTTASALAWRDKRLRPDDAMAKWIAIGIATGAAIGASQANLLSGIGVGIALGIALHWAIDSGKG